MTIKWKNIAGKSSISITLPWPLTYGKLFFRSTRQLYPISEPVNVFIRISLPICNKTDLRMRPTATPLGQTSCAYCPICVQVEFEVCLKFCKFALYETGKMIFFNKIADVRHNTSRQTRLFSEFCGSCDCLWLSWWWSQRE